MPKYRSRHTKIIATLGPSSNTEKAILALFEAGADIFRLNMSHGNREDKKDMVSIIRQIEAKVGRPIAIMADLQGPKIRIGKFKNKSVTVKKGDTFQLDMKDIVGDEKRVSLPHPEIFKALETGMQVLINDGKIRLEVISATDKLIKTRVITGGILSDQKGVNLPDAVLPLSALTDKDHKDLEYMLGLGVDWVALSFVQRADDVAEVKKIVKSSAAVLAKIEKPAAIQDMDRILEVADAVMVARGDLGVEAPVEDVPNLQKQIIRMARRAGRPVVVATQMLESMIHSPIPTRAEVSDVANAVYEGADAVMLSAESAAGEFPVEAVRVMAKVARKAEREPAYMSSLSLDPSDRSPTAEDAITEAAGHVTKTVRAAAIVTYTTSGSTAVRVARERPSSPILALTPRIRVARKLCLVWGLYTVKTRDVDSFEEMVGKARRMALRHGLAKAGQRLVITAGVPFGTPGATNVLHIAWMSGRELDHDD